MNKNEKPKKSTLGDFGFVSPFGEDIPMIDLPDIFGKNVIVENYEMMDGKFGEYAIMLLVLDGEQIQTRTSSNAIITKLDNVKNAGELPVPAMFGIRKSEKGREYYDAMPSQL